jgi:hypothetical protein
MSVREAHSTNRREQEMDFVIGIAVALRRLVRQLGPYLLVELLLPGGSLVALALFLYRQRALEVDNVRCTGWIAGLLSSNLLPQTMGSRSC